MHLAHYNAEYTYIDAGINIERAYNINDLSYTKIIKTIFFDEITKTFTN